MKKLNNKGFTLIELIATMVLLVLVMGIGAYSITSIINEAKEEDYKLLIKNIKDATELYYQECKFSKNSQITCPTENSGYYNTTLGKLVEYGFLKGNTTGTDKKLTLMNPKDKKIISNCTIKFKNDDGTIIVQAVTTTGSCPTGY